MENLVRDKEQPRLGRYDVNPRSGSGCQSISGRDAADADHVPAAEIIIINMKQNKIKLTKKREELTT